MTHYTFITTWHIDQPIEKIWGELIKFEHWPLWWKSIKQIRLEKPKNKKGNFILNFTWKGILPYLLTFPITITDLEPMKRIEGTAKGDLEGIGICEITSTKKQTTITYIWDVTTKKKWMNLVAPIAKPIFSWNHHKIMEEGASGLAKHLGVRVINNN